MKFFYPAVISIFLACCSNNSTVETKSDAANSNSAITINSTGTIDTAANTNPNIRNESNVSPGNIKIKSAGVINEENFEALKHPKKGDANVAPIKAVPLINVAPDNSEVSSTMNGEGVPIETRVFKNNPLLAKTEKILADPKNPTLKVYLKTGKIVSFPVSRISDSVSASAEEILIAAGAKPPNAPTENVSKQASKNRAN